MIQHSPPFPLQLFGSSPNHFPPLLVYYILRQIPAKNIFAASDRIEPLPKEKEFSFGEFTNRLSTLKARVDEKEKSLLPPLSGTVAERQAKFNEKSEILSLFYIFLHHFSASFTSLYSLLLLVPCTTISLILLRPELFIPTLITPHFLCIFRSVRAFYRRTDRTHSSRRRTEIHKTCKNSGLGYVIYFFIIFC